MKKRNLFGFLSKKEEPVKKPVYGITADQYYDFTRTIEKEMEAARIRQRPGTKGPSAYMKGLMFARKLLDAYKPHVVGVEQ